MKSLLPHTSPTSNVCHRNSVHRFCCVFAKTILHVKREESYVCDSVPLLETFFYNFIIVPEMFVENLLKKHVCKELLNSIVNEVLQIADNTGIQEKLNQLTKISTPLPMTFATITKRKICVAVTASKKQKNKK